MWTPVASTRADLLGFVLPVILGLLVVQITSAASAKEEPLIWKFLLEILVDVAHVYGTICRTLLDSEAIALNWRLYLAAVPGLLAPTLFINVVFGTWLGWSLLSYYAMFHFAKQPFGVLCLYKARQNERGAFDHSLDYWTCMAGAGCPLLLWHAGAFEGFSWFGADEVKLVELPTALQPILWLLYAAMPGFWLARTAWKWLQSGQLNLGKLWIMVAIYSTWYMGMGDHHVRSMAFINLFHGISSGLLVYHVVQCRYRLWEKKAPGTMTSWDHLNFFLVSTPVAYVSFLAGLALCEDLAWDILINQEYVHYLGIHALPLQSWQRSVAVSVLMLPQLAHYFLDGFIWKMSPQNPGLREAVMAMGKTDALKS